MQDKDDVKFIGEKTFSSSPECDYLHFNDLIYKYYGNDDYYSGQIHLKTNCELDWTDISLKVSPHRFEENFRIRNITPISPNVIDGYAIHFKSFKMDNDPPFPKQITVVVTAKGTIQSGFLICKLC